VVSSLQELDPGVSYPVHNAVLLGEAPRPLSAQGVSQRFRLPNSLEGIAAYCLDQIEKSKRDLPVGRDPKGKIG